MWLPIFSVLVLILLFLDFKFINPTDRQIGLKEALCQAGAWIALGIAFGVFCFVWPGLPR